MTVVPSSDYNDVMGTNATTNVDAQVSYNITDQVRVSLKGLNLESDNRLNAYTHTDRQFVVGLRYTF